MERFSIKTKLIILIVLICGFILLINSNTYAASSNFNITHYRRNLLINKKNEQGLRDGVIKLPLINKTDSTAYWYTSNSRVAIVNEFGYVTGINPGYAKIIAYTANGYSDSCDVYVRYDGVKVVATANKFKGYTGSQMFNLFKQRTGNGFYNQWCALFVSYCYDLNYAVRSYKNLDQYAWSVSYFTQLPNYKSKAEYPNYIPKKGDLIIFDNTTYVDPENGINYKYDHVGMVTSYNAKTKVVYSIEGNIGPGNIYSTVVGYDQYYNVAPYRRVDGKQNMEIRGFLSLNNGL